jgi:hypothetical protein
MHPLDRVELEFPPTELDDVVAEFDHLCCDLVLLEDHPRADVGEGVEQLDRALRDHIHAYDDGVVIRSTESTYFGDLRGVLVSDHARFLVSLEQLRWFYDIVEREDHGGHRQALGQYGRVLTEAVRRHRRDERSFFAGTGAPLPARS